MISTPYWKENLGFENPAATVITKCFRLQEFTAAGKSRLLLAVNSLGGDNDLHVSSLFQTLYAWLHRESNKPESDCLRFDDGHKNLSDTIRRIRDLLINPPPRFLIGTPRWKTVHTIMHGDLNARNLSWAEAFERFFIIDFEHVGYGILGIDEFRLIMSLLSDLWGATTKSLTGIHAATDSRLAKIGTRIELLVVFLDRLSDTFADDRYEFDGPFKSDASPQLGGVSNDFVVKAIGRILSSIRRGRARTPMSFGPLDGIGADYWKYVAFCAAAKELEYSLRDLTDELVEVLNRSMVAAKKKSEPYGPALLLSELQANSSASVDQKRIGARLISSFCCVCATLPSRPHQ